MMRPSSGGLWTPRSPLVDYLAHPGFIGCIGQPLRSLFIRQKSRGEEKKRSRGDGQERRNPLKFKQIGKVILLIFETSREIPRVLLIWNNVVTI